jgi:hypothetical protein
MKRLIAVLSFALMVAACSSTRGNLLSRTEYHDDEVFEREEYHYTDGNLALVTRVIYYNNAPDSSWTEYEIRRNGQTTDTIETINSIKRNIKSSDGSVRSYRLIGDEWKETSFLKKDDIGMDITENAVHVYDKKGRILSRELFDPDETDDDHPTFITDTYKYIGRGKVIRIESKKEYRDGSYHNEPIRKYIEKYKNGLRTKVVAYMMKDGKFHKQSVNTWKYDFSARVPLKSFAYSPSDYIIFRRPWQKTIWTYEK